MRGVLIDPYTRTVSEIEIDGSLAAMQELLQVETVCSVRVSREDILWVDDEGLLKPSIPIFRLGVVPDPLAGRGLVLGITSEGENRRTVIPLDFVQDTVRWTSLETTGALRGPTTDKHPPHGLDAVVRLGSPILRKREDGGTI